MSQLAIDGGAPVRTEPWPTRVQIDDREINAVMALMTAAKAGGAFDRYGGTYVTSTSRSSRRRWGRSSPPA